jgi:cytochrome c
MKNGALEKENKLVIFAAVVLAGAALWLWLYIFNHGNLQKLRAVDSAVALTHGGNPAQGYHVILGAGCAGCHTIPGIPGARGKVGPDLTGFKDRAMIAGVLANSGDNLIHWIHDPRSIDSKTAMPDLGLTEQQARDAAAYLYAPEKHIKLPSIR